MSIHNPAPPVQCVSVGSVLPLVVGIPGMPLPEAGGGGRESLVQTLRQHVHTALREKILRREIRPGQRLIERELATTR
jgi:hypothetical protein